MLVFHTVILNEGLPRKITENPDLHSPMNGSAKYAKYVLEHLCKLPVPNHGLYTELGRDYNEEGTL